MRAGGLKRSKGGSARVGCVLDIDFRKVDVPDGQSFMSRDTYGHSCTIHGMVWNLNGQVFDGVSARVNPPAAAIFSFVSSDKFSFVTQFKGGNLINPVYQMLFDKLKEATIKGYNLGMYNNERRLTLAVMAGAHPANAVQAKTAETIADDRWVNAEGYYDGSQAVSGCFIYIGGDPKALTQLADGDVTGDITNDQNSEIGGRNGGNYPFNGLIALMRVYKTDQYAAKILQRAIRSSRN